MAKAILSVHIPNDLNMGQVFRLYHKFHVPRQDAPSLSGTDKSVKKSLKKSLPTVPIFFHMYLETHIFLF